MIWCQICNKGNTWRFSREEKELIILPEHMSSFRVFSLARIAQALVFCVVFCRSLFVLSFFSSLFFFHDLSPNLINMIWCHWCNSSNYLSPYIHPPFWVRFVLPYLLCSILSSNVCFSVLFLMAIVLSILLQVRYSGYTHGIFSWYDSIRHVYANNISGIQTSYKFIMHLKMKHKMKQNIDIFMPLNIDNCQVFVAIICTIIWFVFHFLDLKDRENAYMIAVIVLVLIIAVLILVIVLYVLRRR
jgi:hypothetical protein